MPALTSLFAADFAELLRGLRRVAAAPRVALVNLARVQPVEAAHPYRAALRIDEVLIEELHVGEAEVGSLERGEVLSQDTVFVHQVCHDSNLSQVLLARSSPRPQVSWKIS